MLESSFATDSNIARHIQNIFTDDSWWRSTNRDGTFSFHINEGIRIYSITFICAHINGIVDSNGLRGAIYGKTSNTSWKLLSQFENSSGAFRVAVNASDFYTDYQVTLSSTKQTGVPEDCTPAIQRIYISATYKEEIPYESYQNTEVVSIKDPNTMIHNLKSIKDNAKVLVDIPNELIASVAKKSDLTGLKNAIHQLETAFSNNCCQSANYDGTVSCQICQICQTQDGYRQSCQSSSCQSKAACQSCQSQCTVVVNCASSNCSGSGGCSQGGSGGGTGSDGW
jgi:hypothetical protein